MKRWAWTICMVSAAAWAQPTGDMAVRLEPPEIPFHRQAVLRVTVDVPPDTDVNVGDMTERVGGLTVYGVPEESWEDIGQGRRRYRIDFTLDAIAVGDYAIDPVEVAIAGGDPVSIPVPGLRVRELTPEELEAVMAFEPNADMLGAPPVSTWRPWAYAGVAAVLVAAALLAWWFWRRRVRPLVAPCPLPPWERAYQRLKALDQRKWAEAGHAEPYYVELSSILREYIEARFHVHAPEQTTQEFLAAATQSGQFSEAQQTLLGQFLRHSDRVKFARYQPSIEEMERSFTTVLEFIDETVPKPAETDQEEAAA